MVLLQQPAGAVRYLHPYSSGCWRQDFFGSWPTRVSPLRVSNDVVSLQRLPSPAAPASSAVAATASYRLRYNHTTGRSAFGMRNLTAETAQQVNYVNSRRQWHCSCKHDVQSRCTEAYGCASVCRACLLLAGNVQGHGALGRLLIAQPLNTESKSTLSHLNAMTTIIKYTQQRYHQQYGVLFKLATISTG